jgi:APA family basic amino acid/polyamine antiporter
VAWPTLGRDIVITAAALAFGYWALQGSGYQTVYYGVFTVLLGIPVYIVMKRRRGEYGPAPASPHLDAGGVRTLPPEGAGS